MNEPGSITQDREPADVPATDVEAVTAAVLTASRLLVAVSARSLSAVEDSLTLPQFRMLVVLSSQQPLKLVALARSLAVNPSTAMRMADRMVAAGLVARTANPADRRETVLRLTGEGRRVVDDVTARRRAEIADIVARMPLEQRTGLVVGLRAFSAAGAEPQVPSPVRDLPLGWD